MILSEEKTIKWHYDPILTKDRRPSKSILYGDASKNLRFTITTHPNRLLSRQLKSADITYLYFQDEFHVAYLYSGTLKQMKSLAEQITQNYQLFLRLNYLTPEHQNRRIVDPHENKVIEIISKSELNSL